MLASWNQWMLTSSNQGEIVSIKLFWCIEIWWRYEELMKVDWSDQASSAHWTRLNAKFLKLENGASLEDYLT